MSYQLPSTGGPISEEGLVPMTAFNSNPQDDFDSLVKLANRYSSDYSKMLHELGPDTVKIGGAILLGLYRAPAATKRHHAYKGGWLRHCLEMWKFYQAIRPTLSDLPWSLEETDRYVFRGIVNHDLHKVYRFYELVQVDPWVCKYSKSESQALLTKNHTTLLVLEENHIKSDIVDRNIILYSEGGWCEVQPDERTSLATLVYCLDELSGNVYDRVITNTHLRQLPRGSQHGR